MPSFEVPMRMTLAMIFFAIAGIAYYYSIDKPQVFWVAQSSFWVFMALGPVRWTLRALLNLPLPEDSGGNLSNLFLN